METILGTSLSVFIGMTLVLMGGAAFLTGQAAAATWRPVRHLLFYCFLLALTDRFLTWSLFEGELLSISGFIVDAAVIVGIGLFAYRTKRVFQMVSQYPWLYERSGLWSYRDKKASAEGERQAGT